MDTSLLKSRWIARCSGIPALGLEVLHVVQRSLGPDPGKVLVNELGLWALRFLLLCLAMTPLRLITGQTFWTTWRRAIGLWAFFWATLHLIAYAVLLLGLDLSRIGREIVHRPYLVLGALTWCLLLPLAVTSTRAWQKRLKQGWLKLHRLIYPAALLAVVHGSWVQKLSFAGFWPYMLATVILAAVRIVNQMQKK